MEGLEQPCDILVPAALENQITSRILAVYRQKLLQKALTAQLRRKLKPYFTKMVV
jgi:glutamate dehydrogenase (NAD(P)+)